MTKTITLIFCLLTISLTLAAQQVVTGQITDRYDGTPIPGAVVFIAGTTAGTQADRYGNYSLTVPIRGSFEIVVSHIGFQSVSRTIDTPQPFHQINFVLQGHILQEVVITPCLPHRRRDENLFWRTLLGERPSNRGMQVLNPEVVHFCLNADGVLRVFADEPIEIINHDMGYHILYVLQSFEYDQRSDATLFFGMPFFTELIPQNERQRSSWERRRQNAYSVSLTRFIRALYQEQLYESVFFLAKVDSMEQNILTPLSLTQADSVRLRVPFDARRARENATIAFSYSHILQRDAEAVRVNIEQPLFLASLSTPVTYAMFRDPNRTLFRSGATFPIIKLLPSNFIIYSDGSRSGVLNISEYRNSVIGLRAKLPIGYGLSEKTEQTKSHSLLTTLTARNSFPLETL